MYIILCTCTICIILMACTELHCKHRCLYIYTYMSVTISAPYSRIAWSYHYSTAVHHNIRTYCITYAYTHEHVHVHRISQHHTAVNTLYTTQLYTPGEILLHFTHHQPLQNSLSPKVHYSPLYPLPSDLYTPSLHHPSPPSLPPLPPACNDSV